MTTIAYRDGVLAADSLLRCGQTRFGIVRKIIQANGLAAALTGDMQDTVLLRRWLQAGCPECGNDGVSPWAILGQDGGSGIVVGSGGAMIFDYRLRRYPVEAPFYADGSGADIAIGAMAAGATAEEAVRIACRYDTGSSEPVEVVRL